MSSALTAHAAVKHCAECLRRVPRDQREVAWGQLAAHFDASYVAVSPGASRRECEAAWTEFMLRVAKEMVTQ